MNMTDKRLIKNSGFTLVELMIVAGILAVVFTGMLNLFIFTSVQAEMAGNKTLAISAAQDKLEEIRDHDYDDIVIDYAGGGTPGNTFNTVGLTGKGAVYVNSSNTELLVIKVVVSWRNKYNRLIGEDADLDGVLDVGEDLDSNGELSSPITLISMITRR